MVFLAGKLCQISFDYGPNNPIAVSRAIVLPVSFYFKCETAL
jgi:hypothetical protein